ncbi:hypothetical protein AX14_006231 [Amanita brunnescens Koide BX004]|nr:hypothetical protein AX14_006231 [Amanita brunnescens Koide BX004]
MSNRHYLSPTSDDNLNAPSTSSEDVMMTPNSSRSEEYDSMPDFMELSDATDSSESGSVGSAADAHEIAMQAQDSEQNPAVSDTSYESPSEPTPNPTISQSRPASQRSNNRRARVEDDADEERDRRHPSQRISSRSPDSSFTSQASSSAPSPLQSQPPTRPQTARIRTTFTIPSLARLGIDQADPLRFFQHLIPQSQPAQNNTQNVMNDTAMPNNVNPTAPQQPPQPSHANGAPNAQPTQQAQAHGGFTLIVLLSGLGLVPPLRIIPHLGNAHTTLSGNENDNEQADFQMFTEMLLRLGMLGATFGGFPEPEVDDPERARKLVNGLEEVPIGLVRRLEQVGGTSDEDGGRDTMCAICWDQLLDDAGFGDSESKKSSTSDIPESTESSESSHSEPTSESGSPPESKDAAESKRPKIVSLPCAHVFHADCLIPWFSRPRQTTCPTCRFNIDPENLTRGRRRRSSPRMPAGPPPNVPQPAPNDNQAGRQHTTATGNADNTSGQGNETPDRPAGQYIFDQLRIPILVAGQTLFPSGADGVPSREMIDQLRASVEERLRARSGQPQSGGNTGFNNDASDVGLDDPSLPPLESTSPQTTEASASHNTSTAQPTASTSPRSSSQPNTRTGPADDHTVTHSIVFGFDVFVGGAVTGARPEGDTMDVDDGMGNDGNDRNWMGMMRDIFGGRGEAGAEVPRSNAQGNGNANDGAQANTGTGADAGAGRGAGAGQRRAAAEGFPQFLNMNLGPGESLHIASGSGRTMGEAMAQLFSGMGMPAAGNNTPTNDSDGQGQNAVPVAGDDTNAPPQENDNASQNETPETNDGENPGPGDGGMFAAVGMTPLQFMAQMLGFAQPSRARTRSNRNQNQPSGEAGTPTSAPSSEATQAPRAESTRPNTNDAQQPEQGTTPRPAPGNNTNDENSFRRFMRHMTGNLPTGAAGPREENQHMHFIPAGFTIPGFPVGADAPGPIPTNVRQSSEKKQWVPPPAPGPTLRQRIEKKEREAGLRCYDVSCGVGPSDEDPLTSVTADEMKQLTLRPVNLDGSTCQHTFHRSCLVSTERVALRGADAPVVGDDVEISCSVCRAVGRVSKKDWEEGVQQLS